MPQGSHKGRLSNAIFSDLPSSDCAQEHYSERQAKSFLFEGLVTIIKGFRLIEGALKALQQATECGINSCGVSLGSAPECLLALRDRSNRGTL
jgi:hypothetical protein